MARRGDPADPERPYWKFPPREVRERQQFIATDVRTGIRTVSRTCLVCRRFVLHRFKYDIELDDEGRTFVRDNLTPCEARLEEKKHDTGPEIIGGAGIDRRPNSKRAADRKGSEGKVDDLQRAPRRRSKPRG